MPDFRVVLADLDALHRNFADEATNYKQLIPSINPPAVDGGDADLNSVLIALEETFDVAHQNLANSIQHHADTLKTAHDTFQRDDSGWWFNYDGTKSLYDNLVPKE
jgi:hypothetical protein